MLYLSDPHWFGLAAMNYLKYWQARDKDYVTMAVPPLDILAEGTLAGEIATYRLVVRNHGPVAVGPMDLSIDLPAGARLSHCWLGVEGLGRCSTDGGRLTWTLPKLPGGKTTGGPFGAVIDVSALKPGRFEISAWIDQPASQLATTRQEVWLEKK